MIAAQTEATSPTQSFCSRRRNRSVQKNTFKSYSFKAFKGQKLKLRYFSLSSELRVTLTATRKQINKKGLTFNLC